MGILGIITEVTFQFTAPTHTKLITRYLSDDANLVDDIEKMLKVSNQQPGRISLVMITRYDHNSYTIVTCEMQDPGMMEVVDMLGLGNHWKLRVSYKNAIRKRRADVAMDLRNCVAWSR